MVIAEHRAARKAIIGGFARLVVMGAQWSGLALAVQAVERGVGVAQ